MEQNMEHPRKTWSGHDWRDEVQARCILAHPDRYPAFRQEWARLLLARITRSRKA